jgi:endo-1,4-beta-xylanase
MKETVTALRLAALSLAALTVGCATTAGDPPQQVCSNRTGIQDGFFYTFWKDGGEACMTLGKRGHYAIDYDLSGRKNLVAGKGWRTGSETRTVGYRADRFDAGSNSYLTLYGWSVDPLIEYYVVDSWGTSFKPPGEGARVLGTYTTDGGTYDVYRTTRTHKPSIRGTQTFDQFWSIRTDRRPTDTDATITFAHHVAAWRALGMDLGTMDYQVMATEGFGSVGGSDITVWEE